jgi:methionine synthase I (cobalamin-dependent)
VRTNPHSSAQSDFLSAVAERVVIFDGAAGTTL